MLVLSALRRFFAVSVLGALPLIAQTTMDLPRPDTTDPAGGPVPTAAGILGTPTASNIIPMRFGEVEAISGAMNLSVPLGPRLPGRIPLGFSWTFNNQSSPRWAGLPIYIGGAISPIVWPSPEMIRPQVTAWVNGRAMTFLKASKPAGGLPTRAQLQTWLSQRGVDNIASYTFSAVYPSADGTAFFVVINNPGFHSYAILHGDEAVWRIANDRVSHCTNRWGDRVSVTETFATQGPSIEPSDPPRGTPLVGAPLVVHIQNDLAQQHSIDMNVTLASTWYGQSTVAITNSMGLPQVTMKGAWRAQQRSTFVPTSTPGIATLVYLGVYDCGFLPDSITSLATDGTSQSLQFSWTQKLLRDGSPMVSDYPLLGITYPEGLKETFAYGKNRVLSDGSFDITTGNWIGYHPSSSYLVVPGGIALSNDGTWMDYSLGNPAITSITRTHAATGIDQMVQIAANMPVCQNSPGGLLWLQPDHTTAVLYYPTSTPGASTAYRGVLFTHPSKTWTDPQSADAFLFSTSVILKAESLHGTGLPTPVLGLQGSTVSQQTSGYQISGYTVDQTSISEGWDFKCWANPTGSVAPGTGLPLNARSLRTTTYTPNLPTRIQVLSGWDGFSYTKTDQFTNTVQAPAPVTGKSAMVYASAITVGTGSIQRTQQTTQHWDATSGVMVRDSDHPTLSGSQLPFLRTGTGGTVDFGVTNYTTDTLGRITQISGQRGAFTATEVRTYQSGTPLIADTVKTLSQNGQPIAANPEMSVTVGKSRVFDGSVFNWVTSETDKVDGRPSTALQRDALGRPTQVKHPDGSIVTVVFDAWGRLQSSTREARGTAGQPGYVGAATTSYTYDPNGLWMEEKVSVGGKTLITRSEKDAFGRVVKVTHPDGSTQTTTFDGFGQKIAQSPVLKAGQTAYGNFTWVYDGKGRLVSSFDPQVSSSNPQGRRLTYQANDPVWSDAEQGVVTTVIDDRGYSRTTVMDLLNQKKAIIDQKGQRSTFLFDKDGHLLRAQQGNQVRSYTYNDMGWLLSRTEPEEGTTTYSQFNMLGTPLLSTLTGRNGQGNVTLETHLDAHLRPAVAKAKAAGTVSVNRTYTYRDDFFVPTQISEVQPYGTYGESYSYDSAGRLASKTVSDGTQAFTLSQTLDDMGNRLSLTYPAAGGRGSQVETFAYDALLRPTDAYLDGVLRGHMAYDQINQSQVTNVLTLGNGTSTTSVTDKGELVRVTHKGAASTILEDNVLTWTAGGLLLTRGADAFQYDELQRLASAQIKGLNGEVLSQSFSYDAHGNRASVQSSIVGGTLPEEAVSWTAPAYNDSNDLPATVTAPNNAVLQTGVQYDNLGRMQMVFAIPGRSDTQVGWSYDALGRVILENSTSFLLDAEGLRFKRMKADGSVQYTIYGFSREPLVTLQSAAPVVAANTLMKAATLQAAAPKTTLMAAAVATGGDTIPVINGATDGQTVWVGQSVAFLGGEEGGAPSPTYQWFFGDGVRSTGTGQNVSHAYAAVGTYTVTLTTSSSGWTTNSTTIQINVVKAPVISAFGASPTAITRASNSTLSWTTANATSVTLDQGIGAVAVSGTKAVSPVNTATYTLTAANAGGSVTQVVTVAVNDPPPPSVTSFSALAPSVNVGQGTTLNWAVTFYPNLPDTLTLTAVQLGTGITTTTNVLGTTSLAITPAVSTQYTLTASDATNGTVRTVTQSVTVTVLQKPVIEAFTASPSTLTSGQSATLTWGVSNFTSLSITPSIGAVTGTQVTVSPTATTTYTLTATNAVGTSTRTVTINVVSGSAGTLTWQKTMVYGLGQLLSEESATGTVYLQSDQVGSPNYLTDATGAVVGRSKNLPFGERFGQTGVKSARRYTNHEDQDGSPIYMQARTYLPTYGKFAQVDPVYDQTKDDPESWNLYNYVTNNPVTHTDPDGRSATDSGGYTNLSPQETSGTASGNPGGSLMQDDIGQFQPFTPAPEPKSEEEDQNRGGVTNDDKKPGDEKKDEHAQTKAGTEDKAGLLDQTKYAMDHVLTVMGFTPTGAALQQYLKENPKIEIRLCDGEDSSRLGDKILIGREQSLGEAAAALGHELTHHKDKEGLKPRNTLDRETRAFETQISIYKELHKIQPSFKSPLLEYLSGMNKQQLREFLYQVYKDNCDKDGVKP